MGKKRMGGVCTCRIIQSVVFLSDLSRNKNNLFFPSHTSRQTGSVSFFFIAQPCHPLLQKDSRPSFCVDWNETWRS